MIDGQDEFYLQESLNEADSKIKDLEALRDAYEERHKEHIAKICAYETELFNKLKLTELKNSFHTQLAIGILLQDEDTLEEKLNLLTELSLATSKKETFSICEGFRERLCNEQEAKSRNYSLPVIHKVERSGGNGNEVSASDNGDE